MAKVLFYRSTTAAAVPAAANMTAGQLAMNLADERLYIKNSSGTVVEPQPRAHTHPASQIIGAPASTVSTLSGTSVNVSALPPGNWNNCTNASGITITADAVPVGQEFHFWQAQGAGVITFVAGSGQTVVPLPGSTLTSAGAGSVITLKCVSTGVFSLFGSIA